VAKVKKKVTKKKAKKVTKKMAKVARKKISKKVSAKRMNKTSNLTLGQMVPTFTLPSTGQKTFSLDQFKGKNIVLYFYPKDCTPGCTIEGHDFTKLHKQFQDANTEVFGISRDDMKLHEKFKSQENYSIDLLSDTEEQLCQLFSVIKMKNMYGREVRGIERSTFVIDKDGVLVKEWRGVKVDGHAAEVLNTVQSLNG